MSSPHSSSDGGSGSSSSSNSSSGGGNHSYRLASSLSMLQNCLHPSLPQASLHEYCNPPLTAGGAFCGAFGMDTPGGIPSPASSSSAHTTPLEHHHLKREGHHSGGSSSCSSYRASPPASQAATPSWALPFSPVLGAHAGSSSSSNYVMNFALLQAAAAAQAKHSQSSQIHGHNHHGNDHYYHGNSNFSHGGSMPGGMGGQQQDDMATYRKNAILEAENEVLRQKLQRDSAEKMNLVQMLFTQMQQNGHIPGPHAASARATSSSDEDAKPSRPAQSRYWTEEEHQRFLDAVKIYGAHDHKAIAAKVGTRTSSQVRSHSQKFFKKLEAHKGAGLPSMNRKKKDQNHNSINILSNGSQTPSAPRSSSHDIDVEG